MSSTMAMGRMASTVGALALMLGLALWAYGRARTLQRAKAMRRAYMRRRKMRRAWERARSQARQ